MTAPARWAIVLGGADCVWEDVLAWEAIYGRPWDGLVIAANDVGAHWPRELHHWASLHPTKFAKWAALRRRHQLSMDGIITWGGRPRATRQTADRQLQPWGMGSSGMLAVQVAHEVGCTRAVLCGMPMTISGHFGETRENFNAVWYAAAGHWRAWVQQVERMRSWVRSMSGRTRDLLGAPTLAWLLEDAGIA